MARQLIEAGHEVTLLTRGKKPVTSQIPDDSGDSFEKYKSAVKHIACDRTDGDALKQQLSGAGFQGIEAATSIETLLKSARMLHGSSQSSWNVLSYLTLFVAPFHVWVCVCVIATMLLTAKCLAL